MELFSFLNPLRSAGFSVDFVARVPGVAGGYDREEILVSLEGAHRQSVHRLDYQWEQLWRAEQVHGADLAMVEQAGPGRFLDGVDGLLTSREDALLGIYVADCGVIWLADRATGAVALLHSGRKGTEGDILTKAVEQMKAQFGTRPEDLLVVLGPCIRPPHYEVDIAEMIGRQAKAAGVGEFIDCGLCTGTDVDRFYSYRIEKGATGRMLGMIGCRR